MSIISWNIGLTNTWLRKYCMGLDLNLENSIINISKKLLEIDTDYIFLQEINYGFDKINEKIKHIYPYKSYLKKWGLLYFQNQN